LVSAHPSLPTGVLARRWAAEALLRIASGDLDAATELADLELEGGSSELMGARVRLAVERSDMTRARSLVDAWPDEPQPRVQRERRLWTAILDHLDGSEATAASGMAAVVAEAEAEGDVGLFQAAGKYAMGPARALYRAAPTVFLRELVGQPFIAGRAAPAKGLAEQLTDREYMVLVHLPSRQSNAEIANRLGVSLNTVKTHLKHIYRKLDVVGRSEAVEAAERLHLL
jgi:LuxR family maltose regulon positive regulatory protein